MKKLLCLVTLLALAPLSSAEERPTFRLAWSIYVGWAPWDYAEHTGILAKWADRYGIAIELVQVNDYIESINQYTAGQFDAVTATNMDILTIAAASGVDSTALLVGDYSNGNDGIILRAGEPLSALAGARVHLVELSVSHYLLARALEGLGLEERDVEIVNMAEADLVAAWAGGTVPAVVTWNPMLMQLKDQADTALVFDSSALPGEILDLTVVKSDILEAHPELGKALTGAWYETLAQLQGPERADALAYMASVTGTDAESFARQLTTTHLFSTPAEALAFLESGQPRAIMQSVAEFSWSHGLYGPFAPDAGFVGIRFEDGSIWGDERNTQLRFSSDILRLAADDAL
ncbi:MAG: ABC transporter substrate-binding protein [Pseudomonadales bacterium]|jgi:NitT/TauT family transport system substrate-binding protein|nr:ABC transporter substrate-binding protein [Pseudomonadales bacterium]